METYFSDCFGFFSLSHILCNNYIKCCQLNNTQNEKKQNSFLFSSSQAATSIYLDIKSTAYTNEVIEIDGTANKKYRIETPSNNINLIEAKIENNVDLKLKFKINSFDSNAIFNFIDSNNNVVDSKNLYLYKTELGTFISQVSNQINIDNYKAQQLRKNKIYLIEYDEYNAVSNFHSVIETPTGNEFLIYKPLQICMDI